MRFSLSRLAYAVIALAATSHFAVAEDWPMWRGPTQDGQSTQTGLIEEWDLDGKNVLWESAELATRSTPIIMNGKLYTLARSEPDTPREGEQVICADPNTGKVLWRNQFNVYLSDVPAERVAWGNVVGDPTTGRIYAMGVCGYMQCIDGETGKTIWSHSLNEEYGLLTTYGGRTNTCVVFEDLVIINGVIIGWGEMAKPTHRFLAFDKNTGELVWFTGTTPLPEDTTYSTPILTKFDGVDAMVFGSGDGAVWAFQPRTGKPLWQYQLSMRGLNLTPLVDDGKVYMGQSEENPGGNTMGALVALDDTKVSDGSDLKAGGGELWRHKEVMIGRSGMVLVDGRLYGGDDSGNLYIFDAKTGEQIGKRIKLLGTIMRASLLAADGKIYACTLTGWHVITPTEDGAKITHRLRMPTAAEIHGSPIAWEGKIYLPTTEKMYCLGTGESEVAKTVVNELIVSSPAVDQKNIAQLQIVPCEALLEPGDTLTFHVDAFSDMGEGERGSGIWPLEFSVEGPGKIDSEGNLTVNSDASHSAIIVTAKLHGLTGQARVRVVPPLPWKFDFSDGEVPITWIGARYRNVVREVDGEKVMVKVTTIPKGTRSQSLMGPVDLSNYTIQADVRGAISDGKMPDIGLIAQRYTFDMMGASQQLQIRSWTPQLGRFSKSVPFAWKPNTWYTMKFTATPDGEKAILKGKVWPRGEAEPDAWTVEATDEAGNVVGSPGLFGNANDAEIFMDNITVTPNP